MVPFYDQFIRICVRPTVSTPKNVAVALRPDPTFNRQGISQLEGRLVGDGNTGYADIWVEEKGVADFAIGISNVGRDAVVAADAVQGVILSTPEANNPRTAVRVTDLVSMA